METSILKTIKNKLGVSEDEEEFDVALISDINMALSTVTQLGVGPSLGFQIEDASATWDNLLGGDPRLNQVINFVAMTVRLAFDPPQNSFGISAIERQLEQMAWRITVTTSETLWTDPFPPRVVPDDVF